MIDRQEIVSVARCFLGLDLTEGQEEVLTALCEGAMVQWESRLLEGLTPEDCRGMFITACAWTALSRIVPALETGSPTPSAFTAGDLSVSMGASAADWDLRAAHLGLQAEVIMLGYTQDEGFAFLEVAG